MKTHQYNTPQMIDSIICFFLLHFLVSEWLDCSINGGEKGNFIVVGSMEPTIEIWDLNIMDEVQPSLTLGGIAEKKKKKKGKNVKKSITYKEDSHIGPMLTLAWNKGFRNVLASGSADKTVKLWDVSTGKCTITMNHHTDKVQAVAWNPYGHKVLLSGSFDHTVVMRDGSIPSHSGYKWSVVADVESLAWNPHDQHLFMASLQNGTVVGFDIRTTSSNLSSDIKGCFHKNPFHPLHLSVSDFSTFAGLDDFEGGPYVF